MGPSPGNARNGGAPAGVTALPRNRSLRIAPTVIAEGALAKSEIVPGSGPNPALAGILGAIPFGVGAVYNGQYAKGLAHLDSDRVTFRGGTKLSLPFKDIKSAHAVPGGKLVLTHSGGMVVLDFCDRATAEKWALKIRYPKSLIDKLGVKPDSRVGLLGVSDKDFERQLKERLNNPPGRMPGEGRDFIFYAADSAKELAKLKSLKRSLEPAGAIWVVSLKGKAAKIKDTEVMAAARAAGLVDNKVCSFSETHTALKLVIPKAKR